MKKLGTLFVLFLSVIVLVACASGKKDAASGQKLKVVATNSIIADITKNIAGDKIDLHSIVPIGQDPHEYEPLPEDVKKTSEADLIFYNGINLETGGNAWFTKLVENAKKTENNKLDKESKDKFNNIPAEKKLIVTSEGAFKYFSKAYGVPSAYIWEINTEEEGTPEQIKTLVEKLRQTKVPSLFVESSVDDRPMKTVSQDTNIPIYAQIFTDSIAEQGKEGDSYYSMMKYNLDKIAEGLAK